MIKKNNVRISMPTIKLQPVCMPIVGNRHYRRQKGNVDVNVLYDTIFTELSEPIMSENAVPIIQE